MNRKEAHLTKERPLQLKELVINGLKASYLELEASDLQKEKRPILMLHGWGGSKESWLPLLKELGELNRDFIAVDLPGFGKSEEPVQGWNVNDYTKWLENFLAEIYKIKKWSGNYDLIVHSFGGRILLKLFSKEFVHKIKARPERLIMIAAAGIKPSKSLRLRIAAGAARIGKTIMALPLLKKLAPLAQKVLYKALKTHDYEKTSGVMRETFLKVIDEDLQASIEEITAPTLIIWGKRDSYVPVKDAYLMHKQIGESELHIIKKGRHGIHKTYAGQIAIWIKDFLKK